MLESAERKANSKSRRRRGRPRGRTAADGVLVNREQLLKAAEERIREGGASVSLESIAAHAGIAKPILYKEVGDRDKLVNALAENLAKRIGDRVDSLVARSAGPQEGLHNFIEGYMKVASQDREIYLFVTAGTGPEKVQQSLALADGAAQELAESMASHRKSLGADPDAALVWSYGLLGALHFVTLWWLREQTGSIEKVIDQTHALLWKGMYVKTDAT